MWRASTAAQKHLPISSGRCAKLRSRTQPAALPWSWRPELAAPRLAVLTDFAAEKWPSMDLCGEMLLAHFPSSVTGQRCCPPFRNVATRVPVFGKRHTAFNADRLL